MKLTSEEKDKCIKLFQQIGSSRDKSNVDHCIEVLCEKPMKKSYLVNNVIPKLENISKSYLGDAFTCGYFTSSIAESANNQFNPVSVENL